MSECPVCFEESSTRIWVVTPCNHGMCLACLMRLKRPANCPLCRSRLEPYLPLQKTVSLQVHTARGDNEDAAAEEDAEASDAALREVFHRMRLNNVVLDEVVEVTNTPFPFLPRRAARAGPFFRLPRRQADHSESRGDRRELDVTSMV